MTKIGNGPYNKPMPTINETDQSYVVSHADILAMGGDPTKFSKILNCLVFTEEDTDAWGIDFDQASKGLDNSNFQERIGEAVRDIVQDAAWTVCSECGESCEDGEGYDGLCGNCADKAEGGN